MDAATGPWALTDLGFTVTFTLGLTAEEILACYGADPAEAELLTRQEAATTWPGGDLLRVGPLGDWGFCFEEVGYQGSRPEVRTRLSAHTEVFSLYDMSGMCTFKHVRDGQTVESFEPGFSYSVRVDQPHTYWTRTEQIANERGLRHSRAALEAIEEHIGARLHKGLLEGPLLTAYLTTPLPAVPPRPAQRKPPGRLLGSLDPTTGAYTPAP
ncbi:hypothetical protein BDK92_1811 [Micromonospora pisi]|uniref:Uncharacterized protein n=1 Tax=Micromonospora pisi TaxID=589240 RepID=A0A495JGR3_9ACTN|nr:DUF6461 domain-containing protein [Micromonospora pisi]RKR87532.1 hypothetical protein BDK92_1811 [Micromonospora pisi]